MHLAWFQSLEPESQVNMAKLYLYRATDIVNRSGKEAIASFATGDEQKVMLMGLKRFTKMAELINVKELRRQIAGTMIAKNSYAFEF